MSSKARIFLILITSGIIVIVLIAMVGLLAYSAGRNSVLNGGEDGGGASVVSTPVSEKQDRTERPSITETEEPLVHETTASPVVQISPSVTLESTLDPVTVTGATENTPVELELKDLSLLLEVWDLIDGNFDGQLPSEEDVRYGAINGSLELLEDRFTRFIPPDIAELTREQLEGFEGIGAFVDLSEEGFLILVHPIQGQPAALAGLKDGDLVSHVDGISVIGMSTEEIISRVKGPKGTTVTLTIIRQSLDAPFDVSITRDLIQIPTVESEILEDNIGYVRLTSFASNAEDELRAAVDALLDEDVQALILDLRDNPGGFLNQSVRVSDLFLTDGIVVIQRDNSGKEVVFESDDGDPAEEITLVVLVNEGSASASEIVAGAIQDRERGTVIGSKTFGKGSVQQSSTLSDGSELRITIARWYTPNNVSINEEGIHPDIEVETPDIFAGEEDTQLQRAIFFILEGN